MKKCMLKKFIAVSVAASMVFTLSACGKKSQNNLLTKGTLTIGTSADYPPYEFHKEVNGKDTIVGFDLMIADEIAKDLGVKVEVKDMQFDGLLAALQGKKVDMVIAGMNPTAERAKAVDFSKVYYVAVQSVIVRAEDKEKLKSLEDLKGKKVGVQKATTQEKIAGEQIKGAEIVSLGKLPDLVVALKSKKVDAVVVELPVAQSFADKNSEIFVSGMKFSTETAQKGAAIAIYKGNTALLNDVNKTLDRLMKEDKISKFVTDANSMTD
ncbi:transporter substrate-binding domain-containing protein [Candidatus Clostridium radicumherbarum]|uniref:Transporter substrate-binding domain-containing protein n=1 Tax=Candidatus Clostridium radicumherbarum TaxID=3381662 RepID=A0ABW8TPL3_9CLOT